MEARTVKKTNPVKGIPVVVVITVVILAGYYLLSNRARSNDQATTISAVQNLLLTDLESNYPKTPKEVVKMYCEITQCFYGEEYTEKELKQLAKMSRELFDEDLYNNQSDESYLRALKVEIAEFKNEKRVISSFSVASAADVQFYNFEGSEWAQLVTMFSIRTGAKIEPSKERFLLRKDAEGHWKIFGFRVEKLDSMTAAAY